MKKTIPFLFVILAITSGYGQEDNVTSVGDNFSLEGALAMFKNAQSLENFEKLLNEENNNVNNLDLNNDGDIDYITVTDIQEKDTHVIVLSTFLSDTEKQDIATIGIEKTGNEEAQLQIIGDEDLYAENTIVEPFTVDEEEVKSKGPSPSDLIIKQVIVNVWFWPSVRFLYAPNYVIWVSPYHYKHYPRWWKPWRPFRYKVFYNRCAPHRIYYHRTPTHRVVVAHKVYKPMRKSSTLVVKNKRVTNVPHEYKQKKMRSVKENRKENKKNNRIREKSKIRK